MLSLLSITFLLLLPKRLAWFLVYSVSTQLIHFTSFVQNTVVGTTGWGEHRLFFPLVARVLTGLVKKKGKKRKKEKENYRAAQEQKQEKK